MKYRDCLDWVGEGYSIETFASEAEKRGCCRKVSGWPSWLEPGKSRVFLAHRDRHKPKDVGVIFGYFELTGADVVMSPSRAAEALRLGSGEGSRAALEGFWETELRTSLDSTGKSKARKRPRPEPDPLGDEIVDFIVDQLLDCSQPPVPIGGGNGVPTLHASLEEERICGFRPQGSVPDRQRRGDVEYWWEQQSGVYLVDGLARAIDKFFCELLKDRIKDALKKKKKDRKLAAIKDVHRKLLAEAEGRTKRAKTKRRKGVKLFDQAVERAGASRQFGPAVPDALRGHYERKGALVMFKRPFPTYHQRPRADFHDYLRIDGDDLLDQVAAYYRGDADREIRLPIFVDEARPLKMSSIVALLASKTGMGRAQTRRVLVSLVELIAEELVADEEGSNAVRIRGLGTFKTKRTVARKGRKPGTGEEIDIPAKRRVRFIAAATVKRRIK